MKEELSTLDKIIERAQKEVDNIENNNYTIYFNLYDTNGLPKAKEMYLYQTAYTLHELGYNVKMLYAKRLEKNPKTGAMVDTFVGVKDWLGEKYANLPHQNISEEALKESEEEFLTNPSDLFFIPEIFSNIMNNLTPGVNEKGERVGINSRRVIVSQDIDFISDVIPMGREWSDYKIFDVLTTSEMQSDIIKSYFPYMKTKVVNPMIENRFRPSSKQKELSICIFCEDEKYVNKIIKPFQWKNPLFKFVTVKHLAGMTQDAMAEELKKSAIAVWVDRDTSWGYFPIEAIKSDTIVIGLLPENVPDWMNNEDKTDLNNAGIWVDNIQQLHKLLGLLVESFMTDTIPDSIIKDMEVIKQKYTEDEFKANVKKVFESYNEEYKTSLNEIIKEVNERKTNIKK